MPIYEYDCVHCGAFTEQRPLAQYAAPTICPECGEPAPRGLFSAPNLATMPSSKRLAYLANERSAHAPQSLEQYRQGRAGGSRHRAGCSCCTGTSTAAVTSNDGTKSFLDRRPWMISH